MTVTLELTPEVEIRLRSKAEREGQNIADYLLAIANQEAQEADTEEDGTVYDLSAGRHGGGRGQDSDNAPASSEQAEKNKAALAALRTWREQNATDDPKVLEQRRLDWEELKQALNESHTSDRVLFP